MQWDEGPSTSAGTVGTADTRYPAAGGKTGTCPLPEGEVAGAGAV